MAAATSIGLGVCTAIVLLGTLLVSSAAGGAMATRPDGYSAQRSPPAVGDAGPSQPIQPIDPGLGWHPIFPPSCDPTRESCVPVQPPVCTGGPICIVRKQGESSPQAVARFAAATGCNPGNAPPPKSSGACPAVPLPGGVSPEQYELEPDHLPTFEGFVPYMYVDTTGNVTVGYGDNLTANGASSVTFYTQCASKTSQGGCICDATHACTIATAAQVAAEYKKINDIGQPATCTRKFNPIRATCHRSTYYKRFTSLLVSESASFAWMSAKLDATTPQLIDIFPDFNTYPPQVQAALYDMIYNLGVGNYCTRKNGKKVNKHCQDHGLLSYQNFINSIKAKNWAEAATQSYRNGVSRSRNEYVAGLLDAAAYNETACHAAPVGPVDPGKPIVKPPGSAPPVRVTTVKDHAGGGEKP